MRQSLPLMHFYSGKLLQFYSGVDSELSIARWRAKIVEIKATIEALRNQALFPPWGTH